MIEFGGAAVSDYIYRNPITQSIIQKALEASKTELQKSTEQVSSLTQQLDAAQKKSADDLAAAKSETEALNTKYAELTKSHDALTVEC